MVCWCRYSKTLEFFGLYLIFQLRRIHIKSAFCHILYLQMTFMAQLLVSGYQLEETARSSQENMDLSLVPYSGWHWNVIARLLGCLHSWRPWKRDATVCEDYALMMMTTAAMTTFSVSLTGLFFLRSFQDRLVPEVQEGTFVDWFAGANIYRPDAFPVNQPTVWEHNKRTVAYTYNQIRHWLVYISEYC